MVSLHSYPNPSHFVQPPFNRVVFFFVFLGTKRILIPSNSRTTGNFEILYPSQSLGMLQ